jgi:hypothetical protein
MTVRNPDMFPKRRDTPRGDENTIISQFDAFDQQPSRRRGPKA